MTLHSAQFDSRFIDKITGIARAIANFSPPVAALRLVDELTDNERELAGLAVDMYRIPVSHSDLALLSLALHLHHERRVTRELLTSLESQRATAAL